MVKVPLFGFCWWLGIREFVESWRLSSAAEMWLELMKSLRLRMMTLMLILMMMMMLMIMMLIKRGYMTISPVKRWRHLQIQKVFDSFL